MIQSHRYKEIQLAELRSFCLAATEGNFTSAATALGLSASTVWQQVRALERELRAKLLNRPWAGRRAQETTPTKPSAVANFPGGSCVYLTRPGNGR